MRHGRYGTTGGGGNAGVLVHCRCDARSRAPSNRPAMARSWRFRASVGTTPRYSMAALTAPRVFWHHRRITKWPTRSSKPSARSAAPRGEGHVHGS